MLAAARTRMIFGLRYTPQLTHAEYQDYLSWVHIMVDVERQRAAQRAAKPPLLSVMDMDEEEEEEEEEEEREEEVAAAAQAPASAALA